MKTTMNLATSKGFIFRNGKLMAYEFISALVDYESEQVEYICKLGGKKTSFVADECPVVYEDAKAFKAQRALKSTEVKWGDMLHMVFGVYANRYHCNESGELKVGDYLLYYRVGRVDTKEIHVGCHRFKRKYLMDFGAQCFC